MHSLRRRSAPILIPLALLGAGVQAASDPGEAIYRVAHQLLAEGKLAAALIKLDEAVAAAPRGPFADDALLAAAVVDYPARATGELGRASADRIARAGPRLEKIVRDYRDADRAPEAALRLGFLQMEPANPAASLDAAFATFLQVARLYPGAPEAGEAIFAAGECHLRQGLLREAIADDARIVLEHSRSPLASGARVRLAETCAILGERTYARILLAEGGAPGEGAPGSSSPETRKRSESLLALLDRTERDSPSAPGTRVFDKMLELIKGTAKLRSIAVAADGDLWLLTETEDEGMLVRARGGEGSVVPASRGPVGNALGMVFGPGGEPFVWDERGIAPSGGGHIDLQRPTEKGEMAPVKKIVGVALGAMGEIYALDAGTSTLLAFGPEGRFRSVLAKFESRPRALAAWHGTLFVLLPEPGEISVIHPSKGAGGATSIPLRGPGWEIRDAAGMALDTLGSLYILDDKAGSVTVLDRTGQRVASIVPARGEPGDLRSATALAVDASGVVYVAGRREPGVSRFR